MIRMFFRSISVIFLLLIITSAGYAQNSVKGIITDTGGDPLPYVNVLVINNADSLLAKGGTTMEDGSFNIDDIPDGTYRLLISFIGYAKHYTEPFALNTEQRMFDAGKITLAEGSSTLDEMEVVAQKPFIEHKLDKMIINVENSIVSAGNSALDVLSRSPGVIVDKDGNISIKGKAGVNVYIDGKPTYLSAQDLANMLRNLPADQIQSIEIITNPSAKYDAAGNAGIINIVLKKNTALGLNGRVSAGYGQGYYPKFNGSVNANYRLEKWNFFGSYNVNERHGFNKFELTRKFRVNDQIESIFEQTSDGLDNNTTNSGKFAIDYFPNQKHSLGFFVNGMSNSGVNSSGNHTYINSPSGTMMSGSYTNTNNSELWQNISGNFNYTWKVDTTGKELIFNIDYAQFSNSMLQSSTTTYFDSVGNYFPIPYILRSELPSSVEIRSSKLDYTHTIGKKIRMEAGAKVSYVTTDNNAQFWYVENGVDYVDTTKTNHFKYTEQINAGYINYLMEVNEKLSFQVGARGEQTIATGEQITIDSVFVRNYFKLFPSGFITYKLNKNNELGFTYSKRIERPDYQDLNPFIYFLDPYTYMKGNTMLKPQYTNSFELSHTLMGFLTTSVSYAKTTDVITQITTQIDSTRTTYATSDNLSTNENWSFSTMLPLPGKKFTSMNFINVFYNRYKGAINGDSFDTGLTSFMINSENSLQLKNDWSIQLSGFYMSRQVYGIFIMQPMSNVSIGVQKFFNEKKGSIRINYSDIFWMSRFRGSVVFQNMDINMNTYHDSRVLNVQLVYKFGSSKTSYQRKESGAGDEIDRVKKDN